MTRLPRLVASGTTLALVATLAACQGAGTATTTGAAGNASAASSATSVAPMTAVDKNAPLYAKLPEDIKSKGKIVIGSEVGYPPMEYYAADGKTILGFDKDLSELLAHKLGVPVEWQNSTFDGLITQLDSNRIDMIMASMADTKERQAKVDFVDYYVEGSVLLGKAGGKGDVKSLTDACGQTVTVQRGTAQEDVLTAGSKACTDAGKKAIDIMPFDKESDALLQVKQGRAVATLESAVVAAYNVTQSKNAYAILSEQVPGTKSMTGIGIAKSKTQLRDAVKDAMDQVLADGSYATIITTHGLENGRVESVTINAGE